MADNHPTKKRRVGDGESGASSSTANLSLHDSPSEAGPGGRGLPSVEDFDPAMIAAVIGEQLPSDVLKRLKDISGGNTERGMWQL
jgi:hypothetical protein